MSGERFKSLQRLWREQNGICAYCRRETFLGTQKERHVRPALAMPPMATRDHKHPKHRGGTGGNNLVMACVTCNNVKGSRTWKQWVEFMAMFPQWWIEAETKSRRRIERRSRRGPVFVERARISAPPIAVTMQVLSGREIENGHDYPAEDRDSASML